MGKAGTRATPEQGTCVRGRGGLTYRTRTFVLSLLFT